MYYQKVEKIVSLFIRWFRPESSRILEDSNINKKTCPVNKLLLKGRLFEKQKTTVKFNA